MFRDQISELKFELIEKTSAINQLHAELELSESRHQRELIQLRDSASTNETRYLRINTELKEVRGEGWVNPYSSNSN